MKRILASLICASAVFAASASSLTGVLDGMFTNVTGPSVVNSQLRGSVSGGSAYIRSPIGSINPIAIDPPRLSAGCGGIDLFLGSFSYISADKLTQFIRQVAQNAAPLAFKMAIDSAFPQLGGLLDKFEQISREMTGLMKNSCQMAQGLVDAAKNPSGAMNDLSKAVSSGMRTAGGWATDLADAASKVMTKPSESVKEADAAVNSNGSKTVPELGNITWNALGQKSTSGYVFRITTDPIESKEIIMSLVGSVIRVAGDTDGAEPKTTNVDPILTFTDLARPQLDSNGQRRVKIWRCIDNARCKEVEEGYISTGGVAGYVRHMMLGSESATTDQPGSIVYQIKYCNTSDCGLTTQHKSFLTSTAKIPVVGLLRKAQYSTYAVDKVATQTMDILIDDVTVAYGKYVLETARKTYSNTQIPKPEKFDEHIKQIQDELGIIEARSIGYTERLNALMVNLDAGMRSQSHIMGYKTR